MNVQRLTLDLDKSSVPRGRVTIAQCDHDGTTVEAEIYDNGIAVNTSGLSAYLVMRLPDGRHYYRVPATLDGHVATALVDEAYAATATGTTEIAYFELVGSEGVVYSTSRFGVRVLPSATADATVPETWDGEVERLIQQLDDAIETATDAANVANAAAANADATADGVESRVQEMAQDAAETATADAEQRIQDAIDAMGDISELAVPLMSADVRGGAKLEENGGLVLRDEKLGIGSLVQESDGAVRGGIAELTAEGHAEQASTTGKNLLPVILAGIKAANTSGTWSGNTYTINGVTFTVNADGSVTANGTCNYDVSVLYAYTNTLDAGTYIASGCPAGGSGSSYRLRLGYQDGYFIDNDTGNGTKASTISSAQILQVQLIVQVGYTVSNLTFYPMIEAGSTKTAYEPYTGAVPSPSPEFPQTIEVVRGRNLYNASAATQYRDIISDGTIANSESAAHYASDYMPIVPGQTYHQTGTGDWLGIGNAFYDASKNFLTFISGNNIMRNGYVFTAPPNAAYVRATVIGDNFQLERGSVATPYVPYGYVGMEARDPDTDELISCTALPLPSRGWVAGLPDGTADVLTLNGAGKVEWEENVGIWHGADVNQDNIGFDWASNVHMFRVSAAFNHGVPGYNATLNVLANRARNDIKASVMANAPRDNTLVAIGGTNYLFFNEPSITKGVSTAQQIVDWLQEMELYLPLATPITEECGYVEDWPTDIPEGAVISIPELDAVNIEYFIDSAVTVLAKQWYARAYTELGDAIVDLAQRVSDLEG